MTSVSSELRHLANAAVVASFCIIMFVPILFRSKIMIVPTAIPRNPASAEQARRRFLTFEQLELRTVLTSMVDVFHMSDHWQTNLPTALFAGQVPPGTKVTVNASPLSASRIDAQGNFAVTRTLSAGTNQFVLEARNALGELLYRTVKSIEYIPGLSLDGRLLYVDVVPPELPGVSLNGTIVVNPDEETVLGYLPGKHIRAISPDGDDLIFRDRTVRDASTMIQTGMLPFSGPIESNSFLISQDGTRAFSGSEQVDLTTDELLPNLSRSIVTGNAFGEASIPGGPAISPDGDFIYAGSFPIWQIPTDGGPAVNLGSFLQGSYLSDIAVSPDGTTLLTASYGTLKAFTLPDLAPAYSYALPDFSGEIDFLSGSTVVVGGAGNPQNAGGGVTFGSAKILLDLADNLVASGSDDVFASSGNAGIAQINDFAFAKQFILGVNQFHKDFVRPKNDQIRDIVLRDRPHLSVSVADSSMSEEGGTTTATITRDGMDVSQELEVTLSSSDESEATLPTSVIIPAGQHRATFTISAMDDSVADRSQLVSIEVTAGNLHGRTTVSVVDPPNRAPVLNPLPQPSLPTIVEDTASPSGIRVRDLIKGTVTDADDESLKGIAVTWASGASHGEWQFSLNGGATWAAVGTPTEPAARLIPGYAFVRYVPQTDFNGTVRLYYRAWDQTEGTVGTLFNHKSNHGGTHACSTGYSSATSTVTPVNDPPKLGLGGTLGYVHDDPAIRLAAGALVSDIDSANFYLGRLRVWITDGASTSNRLSIGSGFSVDANNNVLQGTTVIGKRVSNGWGTNELVITFRWNVTPAIAQQLVRAITFKTVGGAAGQRKVVFTVSDGDGGLSAEARKTVNVS